MEFRAINNISGKGMDLLVKNLGPPNTATIPAGIGDAIPYGLALPATEPSAERTKQVHDDIFQVATVTPDSEPSPWVQTEASVSQTAVSTGLAPGREAPNCQREVKRRRLTKFHETVRLEKSLTIRDVRTEDVDQLVTADMRAFAAVYKHSELKPEELRSDLTEKFKGRIAMLGSRFIRILEMNGKIAGSITGCPTSKPPEDFTSWEETTDNGTLRTTYDPTGKYLYVVSLSTTAEASKHGGGDMLMANIIGRIIGGDFQAYFESRVPGLRGWVRAQCRQQQTEMKNLNQTQLETYAQRYFELTAEVDGKSVPFDPLLRIYESRGCSFVKIVSDAYKDPQSLNFGVVCHYNNPLPLKVKRIPGVSQLVGRTVGAVSHSPWLTQRVF